MIQVLNGNMIGLSNQSFSAINDKCEIALPHLSNSLWPVQSPQHAEVIRPTHERTPLTTMNLNNVECSSIDIEIKISSKCM